MNPATKGQGTCQRGAGVGRFLQAGAVTINRSLRQTVFPVVRSSVLMHHRCNENPIGEKFIKYGERKTTDETSANICVFDRTELGESCDPASSILNSSNQVCSKARVFIVQEASRFHHFLVSFRMEDDFHCAKSSRAILKASSASIPLTLPVCSSWSLRFASANHNSSTSVSGCSSMVETNC